MSQNTCRLLRVACGLMLLAPICIVGRMAREISRGNSGEFLSWNSLYDYISVGTVVASCLLLGAIATKSMQRTGRAVAVLGFSLLAIGAVGHYGLKFLSDVTLAPIPPMKQLKPNAAQTVLGFHYLCPISGGTVAFGDGSVKYVEQEEFATLRHADFPEYPPEFISPVKKPPSAELTEGADQQPRVNALSSAQERIKHGNNLKQMAVDHFHFQPRDGFRVPLKPEHFKTYPGMTDELRTAIFDGTYVWYFGWEPTVSYTAEKSKALWYDFASWASLYIAGLGAGAVLTAVVMAMKHSDAARHAGRESN